MVLAWQEPDFVSPEDEVWCNADPGDAYDLPDLVELLAAERPAWHRRAACRGQGVGAWFPERGQSLEPAREVCAGCEVREECLASVADEPGFASFGIWGGMSPRQRRLARRSAA